MEECESKSGVKTILVKEDGFYDKSHNKLHSLEDAGLLVNGVILYFNELKHVKMGEVTIFQPSEKPFQGFEVSTRTRAPFGVILNVEEA